MLFNAPLFLSLLSSASLALGQHIYSEGDKFYAQPSDVDLGHGTTIFNGVKYAFPAPPPLVLGNGRRGNSDSGSDMKHWYISNANGTEIPHWKYLPNVKVSTDTTTTSDSAAASSADGSLERRQQPPSRMDYYNLPNCQDWDAQNSPVTLNQCVWNRALVAWGSSRTPPGATCRYIVNYYNSGCGFGSTCSGYISQTLDFVGCFTPSTVFCSTFARCCLSGC